MYDLYHLLSGALAVDGSAVKKPVRATYVPTSEGLKLARVQSFSRPIFLEDGFESCKTSKVSIKGRKADGEGAEDENVDRSLRRAKRAAFDLILCNPDLDAFCTLTYSPEWVSDRTSYDECYKPLGVWLSNRVQRKDLKYVLVPERHVKGGIHFHMLCNSCAIELERARSAKDGRHLSVHGRPLYNITDWRHGHSTAELVDCGQVDREKVSKYIFKYMGKQGGQKIGGRFFLHGGELAKPVEILGDTPEEFIDPSVAAKHVTECEPVKGVTYKEWSFI